jgi:hypothetical protein
MPRNPFMSFWLSVAHRGANTGRARLTAEARRQQSKAAADAIRTLQRFWTQALLGAKRPKDH